MFEMNGKYSDAKVMIDSVDTETVRQVQLMVNHPAASNPVAIMPDCHAGKGCVIGFTMKVGDKVVPNWVGVDIGCGMLSVRLPLSSLSDKELAALDVKIRENVPMGMNVNSSYKKSLCDDFVRLLVASASESNSPIARKFITASKDSVEAEVKSVGMNVDYFWTSIGSLGGGNHFIEIGRDEAGRLWLTVHTGSRNFGKTACEHFDDRAQEVLRNVDLSGYISELKARADRGEISKSQIGDLLGEKQREFKLDFDVRSSAYVTGDMMDGYLSVMFLAQTYAALNRSVIVGKIVESIGAIVGAPVSPDDRIETTHNFISFVDGIVRKGAIRSYVGERMIIPFNMRDGLLMCEGKSNPEWNYSAPHGAGRVLSRRQAKDSIVLEDYQKAMSGIFTTSVGADTIDESPMAYKDAAMIEEAIAPTATIIHRVKPIYNVKAS